MIHRARTKALFFLLLSAATYLSTSGWLHAQRPDRAWLQKVRIAAYPLTPKNAEEIVVVAQEVGMAVVTRVFADHVDVDHS